MGEGALVKPPASGGRSLRVPRGIRLGIAPGLLTVYRIGLLGHTALIGAIAAFAYAGRLPRGITVVPYYDTITHFVLLGLFGFFLDGALAHRRVDSRASLPRSISWEALVPRLGTTIALVLATTEEIAQRLSPRRSSTWSDFAANTMGILIGSWIALRLTEVVSEVRRAGADAASDTARGGAA